MRQNQQALNQSDAHNGNHGDHMLEIFQIAGQAAQEMQDASLPESMEQAASLLEKQVANGSAIVYAYGLRQMAEQFRRYSISLEDLVGYVKKALREEKDANQPHGPDQAHSGDTLKALLAGMASWGQTENGRSGSGDPLDMGVLFEFGMAYLQAKQRGGDRAAVLSDAAASVSPLGKVPHRRQSGKLAFQSFLQAMQKME